MNLGTIRCTEVIMEDNNIMRMKRAIMRKVLKMWEQLTLGLSAKASQKLHPKSTRSVTEKMHIKVLSESTPKSRPVYHPNCNHLNYFYESQELGS